MIDPLKLPSHWRRMSEAARSLNRSPFALLPRFVTLFGPGRYRASEIFRLGLLGLPSDRLDEFISKTKMRGIQRRLNPVELAPRAKDKSVFHRHCAEAGLPTPRVLAELDFSEPALVLSQLAGLPDGAIVIKPSLGYYGRGVLLLDHRGGRFAMPDGTTIDVDRLVALLDADPEFNRWIVQPRIVNHPDVLAISPSKALQTLRIVTFVDDAGEPHVLASQWRLARPDSITDNFSGGDAGNVLCNVDTDTGRVGCALGLGPGGIGMVELPRHPVSGLEFSGLRVPLWHEATALAQRAAMAMLPMSSIGWDIAITPNGPMIIEANHEWDPQNADGCMGERLRYMAARTAKFSAPKISWTNFVLRRDS